MKNEHEGSQERIYEENTDVSRKKLKLDSLDRVEKDSLLIANTVHVAVKPY